jgi:acetyltransferase-like isoleucine patch superfamily enzyme
MFHRSERGAMTSYNAEYMPEGELRSLPFRHIGDGVLIDRSVSLVDIEKLSIGDNVRIDAFTMIIATGEINIGSHIHISAYCCLAGRAGIELNDFSGLSSGVRLYSVSDDYSGASLTNVTIPDRFKQPVCGKVLLGRHVIIGSGTIVLPSVHVAEGCAIGAMSLVTKSTEAWGVYAGIPARRIRDRSSHLLSLEEQYLHSIGGRK